MRDLLSYCRTVVSSLQGYGFPEAIVVGGAIRDLDNRKAHLVKDIDVVIFDRPGYLKQLKRAMAGFQHKLAVSEQVANYLAFENVACVHEFWEDEKSIPVQVVVARTKRTAEEILERHDFGFCQIGFDGTEIIKTEAYKKDKKDHTFTLVRCRDAADFWRSAGRYQRLAMKYPGWKMIHEGKVV